MGKRKAKEPQETPKSNGTSACSDIFNELFGNVSEQNANSSLFSEKNPFKRKPLESNSSFDPTKNTDNASNAVSDNHDSDELKKKKRSKEKKSSIDSDNVLEASGKKLKPGSDISPNFGPQLDRVPQDGETEDSGLGAQATALSKEKNILSEEGAGKGELVKEGKEKRKKKRKRDEVEEEWEAKKYGAVEEGEGEGQDLGNKVVGTKRKTVDNPADMLVTNEGFDDENKLLKTIFVGNLPLKVKKKTLLKEFKKFGEVESVRIRSVPILDVGIPFLRSLISFSFLST